MRISNMFIYCYLYAVLKKILLNRHQISLHSIFCITYKVGFLLFAIFVFQIFTDSIVYAQTHTTGNISEDTTWTAANSPYIIVGNILVNSGAILTIEPGVIVKVDPGFLLTIEGQLIAQGSDTNKIVFTSNSTTPSAGDWGYLFFHEPLIDTAYDIDGNYLSGSILEHCIIEYAGSNNFGAVRITNAHPFINYCTINNNASSGIYADSLSSTFKISNCLIAYNSSGNRANNINGNNGGGIFASGGDILILSNTIESNSTFAKRPLRGGGIYAHGSTVMISGNYVNGNSLLEDVSGFNEGAYGGGISVSSNATVQNNIVSNNVVSAFYSHSKVGGGGIDGGELVVNNIVYNNIARTHGHSKGGGIYNSNKISNNVIISNSSLSGGGLYCDSGQASNNIIVFNSAYDQWRPTIDGWGGGARGACAFNNNLIFGNEALYGGGVYYSGNSFHYNTIVDNLSKEFNTIQLNSYPTMNFNNFMSNKSGYILFNDITYGTNNIDGNNNWWGTIIDSEIQEKIYDWFDDGTKEIIEYVPYLSAPNASAPISPPSNPIVTIVGDNINVSWKANPELDISGYKIYYNSETEYSYNNVIDVGNITQYTFSDLPMDTQFAVTAYDSEYDEINDNVNTFVNENQTLGHESWYSIARHLNRIYVSAKKLDNNYQYKLELIGEHGEGEFSLAESWSSSDYTTATILGNILTGQQNGWVKISTNYMGRAYDERLFVYVDVDGMEIESNNSNLSASEMTNGVFYKGSLPENDIDYYKFTIIDDYIIDIGYLSSSSVADMSIRVYDENDNLMAKTSSVDGSTSCFSLGLSAGSYYIELTSNGDVDQDNYYVMTYKVLDSLPNKDTVSLNLGDTIEGSNNHLNDESLFSFNITEKKPVKIFLSSGGVKEGYLVEVLNGEELLIDSIECIDKPSVHIESILEIGNYLIRVEPISHADPTNPFTIKLSESLSQLEVELNDSYELSTTFKTEEPIYGRLSNDQDQDFYTFNLNTPAYIELTFSCANSTGNFYLTIFKDSDQNLIDGVNSVNGQDISLHMGLGAGRYFVKVSSDGSIVDFDNYYRLGIEPSNQTNIEIEPNNTPKFANSIEKDSYRKGRIFSENDSDYYGFHLSEVSLFEIQFRSTSTTADYFISIVDENNNAIDWRTAINGEAFIMEVYQNPGNLYLKIESNGDIDQFNQYEVKLLSESIIEGLKQIVSINILGANDMNINETQTLAAIANYSDATGEIVSGATWTSIDDNVVTVDAFGFVTAVTEGSTAVIATYGGISGRYDIKVGSPHVVYDQQHGNLILVAGGGVDAANTLRDSTQYLSDLAYGRFRSRLFSNDDIHYINPMTWHDVDGDGYDDNIVDDGSPTVTEFGNSITNWAATQSTDGPLYVYLIDHGGIDKFNIFPNEILGAAQLNTWLNDFQDATGRKVVVVIEACKSGSFTDDLTADDYDRVVITSTDNLNAYLDLNGRISFSQFLIDSLYAGDSLNTSYQKARTKLSNMGLPYSQMVPQLVESPALLATDLHIGGSFAIAGLYPEFAETSASQSVAANQAHTFFATLSDLEDIDHVWATVIPPGYTAPEITDDLESPEVTLPNFDLTDPDGDGRYEGDYNGFVYNDIYKLTFYASNANGNVTVSSAIDVTVTGGTGLDSDGDGMPNDWEDQYTQLDSAVDDASADPDNDTLTNFQEYQHDTHPGTGDTDNDGMDDGWEVSWGFNPKQDDSSLDADQDGVSNLVEFNDGTNPIDNNSYLDHILPTVTSIYPIADEVHVSRDANILVSFDEAMNTGSISISNLTVQGAVSGTHVGSIAYDAVNQKLTLVPDDPFEYGELVNVTVSKDITDLAGNPLDGNDNGVADGSPTDDYAWNFTVEEIPAVTPTNPYDTNADWTIGDFELLDAIDAWATGPMATLIGQACDVDFYMLDLVDLWKLSTYSYDDQSSDPCFPWIP